MRHWMIYGCIGLWASLSCCGCSDKPQSSSPANSPASQPKIHISPVPTSKPARSLKPAPAPRRSRRNFRVVHAVVALCDNQNQAIAQVPAELGNGQQPRTNLYWGAMYGLKTFFDRSTHWKRLAQWTPKNKGALKGVIYRYKPQTGKTVYLIAEAWDGAKMTDALKAFFDYSAGEARRSLKLNSIDKTLPAGGDADLVVFVGHDGLMDNPAPILLSPNPKGQPEGAFVLACQSKRFFGPLLQKTHCPLLLGTTSNMAPEAYTLDAALRAWAEGKATPAIRAAAAAAYAKYQKCSQTAARRLFDAP